MTDVEEPQFPSLAERIAALNKQKNFSSTSQTASPPIRPVSSASAITGRKPPPPPPPGAKSPGLRASAHNGVSNGVSNGAANGVVHGVTNGVVVGKGTPPPLPARGPAKPRQTPSTQPSPPARRTSTQHLDVVRRPSSDSVNSHLSTATMSPMALSRVSSATSQSSTTGEHTRKLPPAFGTTKLPPLPPTRREREAAERAAAEKAAAEREAAQQEAAERRAAEREAAEREDARREAQPARAPALPSRPGGRSHPSERPYDRPPPDGESGPRLPPRRQASHQIQIIDNDHGSDDERPPPVLPARRPTTNSAQDIRSKTNKFKSALSMGFSSNKKNDLPDRSTVEDAWRRRNDDDDKPPPLPMASRPSRSQMEAIFKGKEAYDRMSGSNARPTPNRNGGAAAVDNYRKKSDDEECLLCRDFSEPDDVASRYPLSQLPRQGTVDYLAEHLCGPFPSPTDKARAIFVWCHHNIAYDTDGFFGGCIPRDQTMNERIFSGKSVCEGYARIFETVAQAAGLDCVMVTGHGKGYGFTKVQPGDPVPPCKPTGHAWNAVRIDGGEWKLVDACWGAGNVNKNRNPQYEKRFAPEQFIMTNEEFGERHFPENPAHFFRADGRPLTWAEYIVDKGDDEQALTVFSEQPEQFIGFKSVEPQTQPIHVSQGSPQRPVHFRLGRVCRHWRLEKQGRGLEPYLMVIETYPNGRGRNPEMLEIHYDARALEWWAEVPRGQLGAPGDSIAVFAVTEINHQDARGAAYADFQRYWGRGHIAFKNVCGWKLD